MGLRDILIRKFRSEDAKAVAKIISNSLLTLNNNDSNVEITPKSVLTLSNKRKMYVAVDDNMIIGTASIEHDTISAIFVDAEHQNLKIEEALISLLEEIAANNGFKLIKLEASITAEKAYEKLGYSTTKEVSNYELGKYVVMEKYLI